MQRAALNNKSDQKEKKKRKEKKSFITVRGIL
jgi:hypothetical protein